jgi:hypothetical protein
MTCNGIAHESIPCAAALGHRIGCPGRLEARVPAGPAGRASYRQSRSDAGPVTAVLCVAWQVTQEKTHSPCLKIPSFIAGEAGPAGRRTGATAV